MDAYKSVDDKSKWRVSLDYKAKDYIGMKIYQGSDGVFAIHNGDIVSVCVNKDTATKSKAGTRLIQNAVKNGGVKLDTYDGNFNFYQKMGFEAVSWTRVDKRYVPKGFRTSYKTGENVVFFKYKGKSARKYENANDFESRRSASRTYDKAQRVRDRMIK